MDPYLGEWLNLLIRWTHLVAGIAWIGSSLYFIALDYGLRSPSEPRDAARGVGGESWEIHGGGFYRVEKFAVAPGSLPETLHWYKWEAYATWLSGFALLVVLYYVNAETYLIDRRVADMSAPIAIAISLGVLAAGWLVYDGLCRLFEAEDRALAVGVSVLIAVAAYGLSHVFSARAVYIQVGAMIGTIMVANVLFVIIPGQRELVTALREGRAPNPIHGLRGKQRSVHNNYLTFPVLFAMLSGHFPMTYGHPLGWLVLLAIMAISAWARHFFNLWHQGQVRWHVLATAAAAMALLALAMWPGAPALLARVAPGLPGLAAAPEPEVSFAAARQVIVARCLPCHSEQPTQPGFRLPPRGITFNTPEQIKAQAALINQQAVASTAMPLGNATNMTPEERQRLGAWIRQGARVD